MIQIIATMVAAYVITRMLALQEPGKPPKIVVRVCAGLTIVWTIICVYSLVANFP